MVKAVSRLLFKTDSGYIILKNELELFVVISAIGIKRQFDFFVEWHIKPRVLFTAKAIFVEE